MGYIFCCTNAFIDGFLFTDFSGDDEAIRFGANYEAATYRVNADGTATLLSLPE